MSAKRLSAAAEIGRLSRRILELAPIAELYVGIKIEPKLNREAARTPVADGEGRS